MLYRRGKTWWMGFKFGGRRFQESTRTKNKVLARDIERKRRNDLASGLHQLKKPVTPTTFLVASKDWLKAKQPTVSKRTYEIEALKLRRAQAALGDLLITDITPDDISDYQKARLAEKASPRTINMEVGVVRQVLRRNRLLANLQQDVRMLPVRDKVGRALTSEEEVRLLEACGKSRSRALLPFVVVAINTGMRYSEIRELTWQQVDLIGSTITVGDSKTEAGAGRSVPLNTTACNALTVWATQFPDRKPHHYVFPAEKTGFAGDDMEIVHYDTEPTKSIGSIKRTWRRAKTLAKVPVRFHDLRHSAVTRLLEASTSLITVGELLGWASGTVALMAKRYGHISSQSLRNAVDSLDRTPKPEPAPEAKRPPAPASVN